MGRDVQCDPVTKRRETKAVGASPRDPGVEADRVAAGEGRRLGLYRVLFSWPPHSPSLENSPRSRAMRLWPLLGTEAGL